MIVITCGNPKGGVGKTTLATILATTLANENHGLGAKVGVIDLDPALNLTTWHDSRNARAMEQPFTLIPQSDDYGDLPRKDTIIDEVNDLADNSDFQFLIIDVEGTADTLAKNAMFPADLVLIPLNPSVMDARQAGKASDLVERTNRQYRQNVPYAFVFTRTSVCIKTHVQQMIIEQMNKQGSPLLDAELHERGAYKSIFTYGKTLFELGPDEKCSSDQREKAIANAQTLTRSIITFFKQNDTGGQGPNVNATLEDAA